MLLHCCPNIYIYSKLFSGLLTPQYVSEARLLSSYAFFFLFQTTISVAILQWEINYYIFDHHFSTKHCHPAIDRPGQTCSYLPSLHHAVQQVQLPLQKSTPKLKHPLLSYSLRTLQKAYSKFAAAIKAVVVHERVNGKMSITGD